MEEAHLYRHSRGSGNSELMVRKCHCEERSDAAISYNFHWGTKAECGIIDNS